MPQSKHGMVDKVEINPFQQVSSEMNERTEATFWNMLHNGQGNLEHVHDGRKMRRDGRTPNVYYRTLVLLGGGI